MVAKMKSSQLSCLMWNAGWLWSQCKGIVPHLELIGEHRAISLCCGDIRVPLELLQCSWGLSGLPSSKSRLLPCLMGNTELLCMQCRESGPHLAAKEYSHGFSQVVVGTSGISSSYGGYGPSKILYVERRQDSCLVMRDTSGISTRLGRPIWTLLEVRRETQYPFPVATGILGFLSILKKSLASSPFEALNSECLSRCLMDVRTSVQMRRGLRAFSSVSTGDSDIPSSCEMKDDLHSSHCREIWPSLESEHLGVHTT